MGVGRRHRGGGDRRRRHDVNSHRPDRGGEPFRTVRVRCRRRARDAGRFGFASPQAERRSKSGSRLPADGRSHAWRPRDLPRRTVGAHAGAADRRTSSSARNERIVSKPRSRTPRPRGRHLLDRTGSPLPVDREPSPRASGRRTAATTWVVTIAAAAFAPGDYVAHLAAGQGPDARNAWSHSESRHEEPEPLRTSIARHDICIAYDAERA